MVLGKLDRHMQKKETRPPSYITHKNKFKWIKDLNVRPETMKIIKENIGSKISDIACSNILSDIFPQARETKEKINKWTNQTKKFCTTKENTNKIKIQPTEWDNIFINAFGKGLILKNL